MKMILTMIIMQEGLSIEKISEKESSLCITEIVMEALMREVA